MLVGVAHSAICVSDIRAAIIWYEEVLGLKVLSPPYRMEGSSIERDMGELIAPPVVVTAAIVGLEESDRVIELIEYPEVKRQNAAPSAMASKSVTDFGYTHIGLLCDDIESTKSELAAKGVHFLTTSPASIAGLKTTWFEDPWGNIFILVEKKHLARPYWRQF